MKKAAKIIVMLVIIILICVAALLSYVKFALPNVGKAPDLKIQITPQRIERGKYLANHVALCMDCHSVRDWSKLAGPMDPESFGRGGEKFDQTMGLPGVYYSSNLTPYYLKNWTDGEIFRAITSGVNKNGDALFPIMPYPNFAKMDREDIYSIIAYIRTLSAKKSNIAKSKSDFPMNFIINTIPKPAALSSMPNPNDDIAYGKYLVTTASCSECHTKHEKGETLPGMDFAGGSEFKLPDATITSANITPDTETGIGAWTQKQFVNKFKSYTDSSFKPKPVAKGEFQTVMPWIKYGGMEKGDLEAIYAYLRTLKPVKHQVIRFKSH